MKNPVTIPAISNFFSHTHSVTSEEIFETLVSTRNVKIERIISKGQGTPDNEWLTQNLSEWVILLKGSAILSFEESKKTIKMNPGDYILIPANTKHRVEWTDPDNQSFWLAIHFDKEQEK